MSAPSMFIRALFTIANYGVSIGELQRLNGSRICGKHTQWSNIQTEKRIKYVICRKMNGIVYKHVKGNK
jgi:hypothetical protein